LASGASVREGYAEGLADSHTTEGGQLLEQSLERWEALDAGAQPLPADLSVVGRLAQHQELAAAIDEVSALVDAHGAAGQAVFREELDRANTVERVATGAVALLGVVVCALFVGMARRMSTEVLRPVRRLRDSANQLAAGHLDHRVAFDRNDEIGELAVSFNSMADAIAGSQRTLSRQANHDFLTGLANRSAFRSRLEATLARPERRDGTQAVLFVDLDDFKDVNDTLGHAAGDELLQTVASRLVAAVRPGDLVARLGGDEFAVLLDGCSDPAAALVVAERAVAALATPAEVAGTWVNVGASVGLAVRQDGSDPTSLMREADVAMYSAKGRGKNRVERYDPSLNDAVRDHHALKAEVRDAALLGELFLEYQPLVDLATGTVSGLEALVRWQHPTRGVLPPSAFLHVAEQSGAIGGIGTWVLETAANQLVGWQHRYGLPELDLSVNVSAAELERPGYLDDVLTALVRTGLAPSRLVMDVTESVIADPSGGASACLQALRRLGVRVALDDFGTGYSSIGSLRQLPVDLLKIDRSFVSGDNANRPGDVLLEAIVELAQRLGLEVVPEGIEDARQLARLQALGCRTGQGFFLARPLPAPAVDELLVLSRSLLPVDDQRTAGVAPA
jgi:diguanylate cyclase (GGDEF)-like protein